MDTHQLIPKDKGDIETGIRLMNYSFVEIEPIVDDLLVWIQDLHWPVSSYVANYLSSISEHLTDRVIKVLKGNDDIWKYNCLLLFRRNTNKILDERLLVEINRVAKMPTKGEIEEDVQELAIELIKRNLNDK